jgi:hypothetical protein
VECTFLCRSELRSRGICKRSGSGFSSIWSTHPGSRAAPLLGLHPCLFPELWPTSAFSLRDPVGLLRRLLAVQRHRQRPGRPRNSDIIASWPWRAPAGKSSLQARLRELSLNAHRTLGTRGRSAPCMSRPGPLGAVPHRGRRGGIGQGRRSTPGTGDDLVELLSRNLRRLWAGGGLRPAPLLWKTRPPRPWSADRGARLLLRRICRRLGSATPSCSVPQQRGRDYADPDTRRGAERF